MQRAIGSIHHLDDAAPHAFWDRSLVPRVSISPGDSVVFETREGTGQIDPDSRSDELRALDEELIHPLTGPVAIEGARPGDVLEVEVLDLQHKGWGWNGVIPGFGLLGDEFDEPYIHHYELRGDRCLFSDRVVVPFEPFCGIMGVAPAEEGRFTTHPPRANGGNVDIRHLGPGARVFLPVFADGALFSCGDCHSAQGDGEVNGTGVETPMTVTLRFDVHKGRQLRELQFVTPGGVPLTRAGDGGYFVATAHGPDLFESARTAIRDILDELEARHDLTRAQAYCLSGAAVDLKISEIVNEPDWIVSAYLPLGIFV